MYNIELIEQFWDIDNSALIKATDVINMDNIAMIN